MLHGQRVQDGRWIHHSTEDSFIFTHSSQCFSLIPHLSFYCCWALALLPPHQLQRTEMNWTPSRLTQQQRRRWRLVLEPRRSFIQGDVLYRGRRSRGTAAAVYPDRVMTMWTNENPRREGWRQQPPPSDVKPTRGWRRGGLDIKGEVLRLLLRKLCPGQCLIYMYIFTRGSRIYLLIYVKRGLLVFHNVLTIPFLLSCPPVRSAVPSWSLSLH